MASFRSTDEQLSDVSFAFRSTQLAALLLNVDTQVSQSTAHVHTRANDVIFNCGRIKNDVVMSLYS